MNIKLVLFASLILTTAAATATADFTQTTYLIEAGGQYTYKPSPEGPGISGGIPNAYELEFGIGGTFVYELDTAGTARLLNLHLRLTGNEAIQAAPPPFHTVTADRVEEYLASHTFIEDFIGGFLHLKSSIDENLKLTDSASGNLLIHGGFDATPVDGTGLLFSFSAVAIPEPAGTALVVMAVIAMFSRRGFRFRIRQRAATAADRNMQGSRQDLGSRID